MKFFERTKFFSNMLLLNRRNTIVMFLGLGISLAMISEGLIFIYSFQYGAFVEFNKEIPPEQFTVKISGVDVSVNKEMFFPFYNRLIDNAIKKTNLNTSILRSEWVGRRDTMLYVDSKNNPGNGILITDCSMFSLPADYFSAFEEILYNGSLPYRSDEFLVVTSRNMVESSNLTNLGVFPVFVPLLFAESPYDSVEVGIPNAGAYVNITGVVLSEDFLSYNGQLRNEMKSLKEYFGTYNFLITRQSNIMNYVNQLVYPNANPNHMSFFCRIAFDVDRIDAFNIKAEIAKLNQLGQEISREFQKEGYDVQIYIPLIETLLDFREEFIIFQLVGLLFTTPIIGMALSLTNYSSNLMKKRQKRQISSMIQRGSSRKEVLTVLIVQVIEFTVIAMLLCILIGYPFASLMLKSNGFLNFSGVSIFPAINMIIFYIIIGTAMIFSIALNTKRVWNLANIDTQEAYGIKREKPPFWQRTYVDIVLIILGIALWLVVKYHLNSSTNVAFAYGFGTTAPICLILGSILLITRLYPLFINKLAKIGWNREKLGILGLSAKRSLRRKTSVIRTLILVYITFTLLISSMSTISSYRQFDKEQAYYKTGADILIRNVKVTNDNVKNRVLEVEGVEAGTYIRYTSQLYSFGSVLYSYIFLGVNPDEFAEIGFFEKHYIETKDKNAFFSVLKEENVT
ncbi:MAG: hypothetical protein FK733_18440, partial [Asgard group archaeon]|nr:hypothetical protein [Asgard group archaeon]